MLDDPRIIEVERTGYYNNHSETVTYCVCCNDEIYDYEMYYEPDGDPVCEDCIVDYANENWRRIPDSY